MNTNKLSLKWGTLKSWDFSDSEKGGKLLAEYYEIGSCESAMGQSDTPRQKEIICELIDLCDNVHLSWDNKIVTRDEAKTYVMNYGKE